MVAPSKRTTSVIWTGSDDGIVSMTKDGGKTWSNVTPKDMPDFGRVSLIDASGPTETVFADDAFRKAYLGDLV